MKIAIASSNPHKIREIRDILSGLPAEVIPASELGVDMSLVKETGDTLEENAILKAKFLYERTGLPSLADDTGLFVDALDGEPGVRTARYAGEEADSRDNIEKLLRNLRGKDNRRAHFRTIVAFVDEEGKVHLFEGRVDGEITLEPVGDKGFGYDPIFYYPPAGKTFAQMEDEEKNRVSHRYRDLEKFRKFLWERLTSSTGTEL